MSPTERVFTRIATRIVARSLDALSIGLNETGGAVARMARRTSYASSMLTHWAVVCRLAARGLRSQLRTEEVEVP